MHFFNLKEQMILLKGNQISYQGQKNYLLSIYQQQLANNILSYQEIIERIESLRQLNLFDWDVSLKWIDDNQIKMLAKESIIYGERIYPSLWYQIAKPPLLLFYRGNKDLLKRPLISIVGTRKITDYGRQVTKQFVQACAKEKWCVVSGMAKGIDACVHETAIESRNSLSTIAMIATGLDRVYPKEHFLLQEEMAESQLVISEYLPHQAALKHHFIMRNRLVSGISPVTCVMEAASKSGSLITANYALQENREVYALPGRIIDIQSRGCNELIAAGARPILDVEQVVHEIRELFLQQEYLKRNEI